ncbi:MAG: hypothetical protein J6X55_02135, partial [Victivallales bacterium]|nr:hypothetical protein [Victivallales bacterium]
PVEIQVLWIHALGVMARLTAKKTYGEWQRKAIRSFQRFFIRKDGHGLCDCLHGDAGQTAENSVPDDAIRPNQLLAVTLCDFLPHDIAVSILDACNSLMIPGGNRSLDDADVIVEQPVWGDGRLLNNPSHPYIGRYEGDEDTRRKPAYHNGTAWGWTMPMFCEAMLKVYGDSARDAARCLLETVAIPMQKGCLGHIPEIYDGDAPHRGRGCPAQAWSVSEAFRVWKLLNDTQIPNEGKITKIQ